ncbi:2946_t:CDS:2 [Entrophospora sp. SA101]|nr:2946_t:CDS:2 [Entrophospora sp. SA101]
MNYRYCFNSTYALCKTAFLKLYNISDSKFNNVVKHLHKTKVNIDENLKSTVKNFLNEYSPIHGLPSPMRHRMILGI